MSFDRDPFARFEDARQQGKNPLIWGKVVTVEDIWQEPIADLPDLNREVDDAVRNAIAQVRSQEADKLAIAIRGERGTGKSHAMARVRREIETENCALFAYISPCLAPRQPNSHALSCLVKNFSMASAEESTQWQRLAAKLILTLQGTPSADRYRDYLDRADRPQELHQFCRETLGKNRDRTFLEFCENLSRSLIEVHPHLDGDTLQAMLYLLFPHSRLSRIGLDWLQGNDNDNFPRFRLPEIDRDALEKRAIAIFSQLDRIAKTANFPIVLCFDEIDTTKPNITTGEGAIEVACHSLDRLYASATNLVLLCCATPHTWDAIAAHTQIENWQIVSTSLPTVEQKINWIQERLNWFYRCNDLNPNSYPPLYPFQDNRVRTIAEETANLRTLMEECGNWFDFEEVGLMRDKTRKLLDAYNELLHKIIIDKQDDDSLAAIVSFAMKVLPEAGSENVSVDAVESIKNSSHDLHFAVSGYDFLHRKPVRIGVRVCDANSDRVLDAVVAQLLDYDRYNITRGCLLRSLPIPPKWKHSRKRVDFLVHRRGGEMVQLFDDDIKALAAIERIYKQADSYGFTKAEVVNLVKTLNMAADNPLIREILSEGVTVHNVSE